MKKFFLGMLVMAIIFGLGIGGHFMYKHYDKYGTVVPESWYSWTYDIFGIEDETPTEEETVETPTEEEQPVEEETEESADETSAE